MDGAIAALGTGALGAALLFEFVADRATGSSVEVATTLAYPFGDVLLVSLIVGVIALTRWRPGRTWTLLLAGLAVMAVADSPSPCRPTEHLPGGGWIEPLYLISAVLLGVEAWQPEAAAILPEARFDGWREMVVPGIVAGAMIALVVMQYFGSASALTTVLWSATMLAVIGRLVLSLRENKRLLEQVRTDRLTGLGSQARLQMDLEARERAPATAADRAPARPQRLQALQRHLRPPRRGQDARHAGQATEARRSSRKGPPTGSAATSSWSWPRAA